MKAKYCKGVFTFGLAIAITLALGVEVRAADFLSPGDFYPGGSSELEAVLQSLRNTKFPDQQRNNAKSIPVMYYHGVVKEPNGDDVTTKEFVDQMKSLKMAGYQTVSIEDFDKFLKGSKNLPEKSFLLTFDDGRKESYYPVDPVLKALKYDAVMYYITSHLGEEENDYYLSIPELKKMKSSGRWSIQSHSRNAHEENLYKINAEGKTGHFLGNKLWLDSKSRLETDSEFRMRVTEDLEGAKKDLEKTLGDRVFSFVYPFGDYGQESLNFPGAGAIVLDVVKSIYSHSLHQAWLIGDAHWNYRKIHYPLAHRIAGRTGVSGAELVNIVESGRPKALPYVDNFASNYGWRRTWGELVMNGSSLRIGARESPATTGGSTYLDGSRPWKDYAANAKINWEKGSNVYITARVQDDDNRVACNFGDGSVRIEQTLNGVETLLKTISKTFTFPSDQDLQIGIKVRGNQVECSFEGVVLISATNLDSKLSFGGVGFEAWNRTPNSSELVVKELRVE